MSYSKHRTCARLLLALVLAALLRAEVEEVPPSLTDGATESPRVHLLEATPARGRSGSGIGHSNMACSGRSGFHVRSETT